MSTEKALGLPAVTTFEVCITVLTALTLIATIIGWRVTAKNQKELLKAQLEGSERLSRIPLRSARRADQFGKVADWVAESEKIRRLALSLQHQPSKKEELTTRFLDWENVYFAEIRLTAEFLDGGLANTVRVYFGYLHLFISRSINGQVNSLVNPLWDTEMSRAKEALTAKLNELDKAVVEQ